MNSARLVRGAMAALLASVLATACSSDAGDAVPRGWISDTYPSSGVGWLAPASAPAKVADTIQNHRQALDRTSGGGAQYLRYRDDMVTVSPYGSGSRIEIESYRNGYQRHRQYLRRWPDPYSRSFRGGGPGSGK
ncbi:DUF4247 domain-containing protein [Streptomyces sp. MS06]|uniref:DUF4247 domain-containing protein n=1 Tax=Streptomyces sp. MS06 TaxID=3385974 RepID=UPI0039A12540